MAVNITAINTAITDTLANASGLTFTQDFDELTEGIVQVPLLQVYWNSTETDTFAQSDRTTFGKGVAQSLFVFHADLYAAQRMDIGQDMAALLPIVDAIHTVMDSQVSNLFGLSTIKTLEQWRADQVTFEYAGFEFVGARFVIPIRVF